MDKLFPCKTAYNEKKQKKLYLLFYGPEPEPYRNFSKV